MSSSPSSIEATEATAEAPAPPAPLPIPGAELVTMVAALMALNALAVDVMLPGLGAIAESLGVANPNDQQLVVVAYVLGFGTPQLVWGPLADRFGRRPVLFVSLAGYTLAGLACMVSGSFWQLLVIRFVHGVFSSGCRVVALAVVRDLFGGRSMARTMSLVMTIFMVVPILAPMVGQGVLLVSSWRWIFGTLALAGGLTLAWTALRLDETLAPDNRRSLSVASMAKGYWQVLRTPVTLGYTVASGVVFGSLFAFISVSEQIFREVFHQQETFVFWFAGIAFALSVASFMNSRLVERLGMRRLGHGALVAFFVTALLLFVLMRTAGEELSIFFPLFAMTFAFFGLIGANFNALAMEPLGRMAGTGSAAFGFATTTVAGMVGGLIGRAYDGTTEPLLLGFVGLGVVGLVIVTITERGRLFGPG